jgi:hypothetical protein
MHKENQYTPPLEQRGTKRVLVDQERAARLRMARQAAGFQTMEDAITRFRFVPQTYRGHENGHRGMSRGKTLLTYSRAFNVRKEWLEFGLGNMKEDRPRIIISGMVGEFGTVQDMVESPASGADLDYEAPHPPVDGDFIAFRVDGDHNYPAFFKSDIIYTTQFGPPDEFIGKQCVAKLLDGSRRLCILGRGSATGLFMLVSLNASPINDVPVIEAAPVVWIKRG